MSHQHRTPPFNDCNTTMTRAAHTLHGISILGPVWVSRLREQASAPQVLVQVTAQRERVEHTLLVQLSETTLERRTQETGHGRHRDVWTRGSHFLENQASIWVAGAARHRATCF